MKKVDYERAKELGRAYYKSHKRLEGGDRVVTATSVMFEDGWHRVDTIICHAGLRNTSLAREHITAPIVATIDLLPEIQVERKLAVSYLRWLFTKSPFRGVYMNTSAKSAFDYGIVGRADKNGSLLVAGLMATRLLHEEGHTMRLGLWGRLVKLGCDKGLAFVIVCYAYPLGGGVRVCGGSNHTVFGGVHSTKESVLLFLEGGCNEARSLRDAAGYDGVCHLWQGSPRKTTLLSNLEGIKTQDYVYKDTPFGKKKFAVNSVDNWCKQAIEISEEFIK